MIWMVNDKPIEEWKDYTDMACEFAISKKEVFSILTRLMTEAGKDGKLILSDAKEMIGDLPSVAPVRLVGEWIRHKKVEDVYSIDGVKTWGIKHQCNKCGFTTVAIEDFGYYDFCPNCGADMRRGDADED